MGAYERRLPGRRVVLRRQMVWSLGIGLHQVGEWEGDTNKYLRASVVCFILVFIVVWFLSEVFETKWRLQTGVESSPWSGCGCVEMSHSGQDGPYHSNLF